MAVSLPLAVVISAVDRASAPLAKLGGRINQFADRATKLGASLSLGVTAPVVGFFTLATRQALETEKAMARLAATSQGTSEQLSAAAKAAVAVPGDFDPADGLDALAQMAKLGLSLNEAMLALPAATNLAIASESELADTSKMALGVLRAYGLELEQVAAVTDTLAAANAASDLGLSGIAGELTTISPLARELGLSLSEATAAVIALAKVGAKPAATLRAAMVALVKPSREAAETLERLNVHRSDVFNAQGELRGLSELLDVLQRRGASAQDVLTVFGNRAGPGMVALLRQGQAGLRDSAAGLSKTGAAAAQAGRRLGGFEGSLWALDNAFEDLLETVARSGLIENLQAVARRLTSVVQAANSVNPKIVEVGLTLVTVAAALGPVILLVGALAKTLTALASAWDVVAAAGVAVAGALGAPLTIILAITAAVVGAVVWWDELTESLSKFGSMVDRVVAPAFDWLHENVTGTKAWQALSYMTGATSLFGAPPQGAGTQALERATATNTAAAAGEAEVVVRFENAPPGTKASLASSSGVGVGLDVGYSMVGN